MTAAAGVGRTVRYYREAVGMSQASLGAALGITPQAVSDFEVGKTEITVARLYLIARVLGVSVWRLLGEAPPLPDAV